MNLGFFKIIDTEITIAVNTWFVHSFIPWLTPLSKQQGAPYHCPLIKLNKREKKREKTEFLGDMSEPQAGAGEVQDKTRVS